MKEILKTLKAAFLSGWTPVEKTLLLLDVFLLGMLLGWLTAPLKKIIINAKCDTENEEDE